MLVCVFNTEVYRSVEIGGEGEKHMNSTVVRSDFPKKVLSMLLCVSNTEVDKSVKDCCW